MARSSSAWTSVLATTSTSEASVAAPIQLAVIAFEVGSPEIHEEAKSLVRSMWYWSGQLS